MELSSGEMEEVFSTPSSPLLLEEAETGEEALRRREESLHKKLLTQMGRPVNTPPTPKFKSAYDVPMGMCRSKDSSKGVDMVAEGVLLATDMVNDALAQQEYVDTYCGQSKNIRMAVGQAVTKQLERVKELKNVLKNFEDVRARKMEMREREEKARAAVPPPLLLRSNPSRNRQCGRS